MLLQSPSWEWSGELPHVALTILHQHAIQGDVTELQLAMVRWIAYSKKALELPLDYGILFRLLQDLDQQWNLLTLTKEEVSRVSGFATGELAAPIRLHLFDVPEYINKMAVFRHI